jgi:hypothetical protein
MAPWAVRAVQAVIGAVGDRIRCVLRDGTPGKVVRSVVSPDAIQVAYLRLVRTSFAMEGSTDQSVD